MAIFFQDMNEEERAALTMAMVNSGDVIDLSKINGIKVGFLGYTYGLNGFVLPEDKPWLVDLIDKEQMKKDMEALSKVSDIQLVSMHWGDEYQTYPNDEQQDLANYLNELGAEVVIG